MVDRDRVLGLPRKYRPNFKNNLSGESLVADRDRLLSFRNGASFSRLEMIVSGESWVEDSDRFLDLP